MSDQELLNVLKSRFEQHMERHPKMVWSDVEKRVKADPKKLRAIGEMERSGGEPEGSAVRCSGIAGSAG